MLTWQAVRSARRPELRVTVADIGARFRCDATPVADDGSHGIARCAHSQTISPNDHLATELQRTYERDGMLRFLVKLKDTEGQPPADMQTILCLSARAFTVHVCGQDSAGIDGPLGVEIIRMPLSDPAAVSGRPQVVLVLERSTACFRLGEGRRGQLLEARSQEEQERIAVAIKLLYPPTLLLPNDYRSSELSFISPRPTRSPHASGERPVVHGGLAPTPDMMSTMTSSNAHAGPRKVSAGNIPAAGDSGESSTSQPSSAYSRHEGAVAPSGKVGSSPASALTLPNSTPSPRTPLLHPKGRGQLSADDLDPLSTAINAGSCHKDHDRSSV